MMNPVAFASTLSSPAFTPVRFGNGDSKKPEKANGKAAKKPRMNPADGIAYLFTHPRVVKKIHQVLPKGRFNANLIDETRLGAFGKIDRIDFKSLDGLNLKGYWMQAKAPSEKTVILGHGYLVDWRMFLPIADRLRQEGYNVFLFDFRGHGNSEGEETSIGFHEGKDLAAAVGYVTNTFGPQSKTLFYMGHSMGASTMLAAPKSLEDHPDALTMLNRKLDGIILDSPFHKLTPTSSAHLRKLLKYKPESETARNVWSKLMQGFTAVGEKMKDAILEAGDGYTGYSVKDFKTGFIFAGSPLSKKPILHIHGTEDAVTPYTHALRIRDVAGRDNPDYRFLTLENEDHMGEDWKGLNDGESYTVVQRGGEFYFEQLLDFLRATEARKKTANPPKFSGFVA